jgi:hypothetical protein
MSEEKNEGWPANNMLEAALGIISNATDWDRDDREEWKTAAREWVQAYQAIIRLESGVVENGDDPLLPK